MASVLKEYEEQISGIPGLHLRSVGSGWRVTVEVQSDDPKQQLLEVRAMLSRLQGLKKQASARRKQIRQTYAAQIDAAAYEPGLGGTLFGSRYRSSMRSAAASTKRRLRSERDRATYPYDEAIAGLDQLISQLNATRLEIQARA